MPTLNMRLPAQTKAIAVSTTKASPAHGCHSGIPPGVPCLSSIKTGVNRGNSDSPVANAVSGFSTTGIITNIGIMTGNMLGRTMDCASVASLQADPRAAPNAPYMNTAATM